MAITLSESSMRIPAMPVEKRSIETTLHPKLIERKSEEKRISDLRHRLQALIRQQKPVWGVRAS
jgi:hypothetical protein